MTPRRGSLTPSGFTLVEMVFASTLFLLMAFVVYRTVWQYFGSYVRTDERLESVTEAWQVLRILREDLAFADFPDGDPANWRNLVLPDSAGFRLLKRRDATMVPLLYRWNVQNGDLSREEDPARINSLLRGRCRGLDIQVMTFPDAGSLSPGQIPERVWFSLKLELGSFQKSKDLPTPFVLETNVIPVFLNLRLRPKFLERGFPP